MHLWFPSFFLGTMLVLLQLPFSHAYHDLSVSPLMATYNFSIELYQSSFLLNIQIVSSYSWSPIMFQSISCLHFCLNFGLFPQDRVYFHTTQIKHVTMKSALVSDWLTDVYNEPLLNAGSPLFRPNARLVLSLPSCCLVFCCTCNVYVLFLSDL